MTNMLKERIGRLQSIGFLFIVAIAKTGWLTIMLIDFMAQVHHGYRRLFRIRAEFEASFQMMIGDIEIKFRALRDDNPGSLCALRVARI